MIAVLELELRLASYWHTYCRIRHLISARKLKFPSSARLSSESSQLGLAQAGKFQLELISSVEVSQNFRTKGWNQNFRFNVGWVGFLAPLKCENVRKHLVTQKALSIIEQRNFSYTKSFLVCVYLLWKSGIICLEPGSIQQQMPPSLNY